MSTPDEIRDDAARDKAEDDMRARGEFWCEGLDPRLERGHYAPERSRIAPDRCSACDRREDRDTADFFDEVLNEISAELHVTGVRGLDLDRHHDRIAQGMRELVRRMRVRGAVEASGLEVE